MNRKRERTGSKERRAVNTQYDKNGAFADNNYPCCSFCQFSLLFGTALCSTICSILLKLIDFWHVLRPAQILVVNTYLNKRTAWHIELSARTKVRAGVPIRTLSRWPAELSRLPATTNNSRSTCCWMGCRAGGGMVFLNRKS